MTTPTLTTNRFSIYRLAKSDAPFILELVNTADWLKFIGNRHISTVNAAEEYISKILANENVHYWVVRLTNSNVIIGVVTFIKKNYLKHHDIGFAFLPQYGKKGYALEARKAVLNHSIKNIPEKFVLATTLVDNIKSIRLLTKLGFKLEKQMEHEGEVLLLYKCSTKDLRNENFDEE